MRGQKITFKFGNIPFRLEKNLNYCETNKQKKKNEKMTFVITRGYEISHSHEYVYTFVLGKNQL